MTSKLTDAPEQIFASQGSLGDGWRWPRASKFPEQGPHENFPYVRVDVYNSLYDKQVETEAKLAKAVDALRLATDACDEGKMVSLGTGGMTIDAQIRRSVYNQVPAWPIEEARVVLDELEKQDD